LRSRYLAHFAYMAYNEDSSVSVHDEPWIQWFCGLKGHEMFCEVERAYIEDGFNLYGLRACVPNFSECLDLMLDRIGPDDSDDSHLTQSACTLYGLIHARYIITAHGLDAMYNKYAQKEFGTCPLVQCGGQPVLPVGVKDEVGVDTVKVFCPKCLCVYNPPPIRSRGGSCSVDGASFGTTFAHLFLMTFSNLVPDVLSSDSVYVPRVFGFRVHQSAKQRNGAAALSPSTTSLSNLKGNFKSGMGTTVSAHSQHASGKVSSLPKDREKAMGVEQTFPPSSVNISKEVKQNQSKSDDKDSIQKGKKALASALSHMNSKGVPKPNAVGEFITENQNVNIVGNGNTSSSKRKTKIVNTGENIDLGLKGNGESSLKMKAKRLKRQGNGVTQT